MSCLPMWAAICLILVSSMFLTVDSCSCISPHPQVQYCAADFVIRAKPIQVVGVHKPSPFGGPGGFVPPIDPYVDGNGHLKKYTVTVLDYYKKHSKMGSGNQYIWTEGSSAACGIILMKDKNDQDVWLLAGSYNAQEDRYQVGLCGFNRRWSQLTTTQKDGVQGKYPGTNNVNCRIPCRPERCESNCRQSIKKCYYDNEEQQCAFQKMYCNWSSTSGKCVWRNSFYCLSFPVGTGK